MSHCTVPTWNSRHQRQQQAVEAEEANQYPHVQNQQNQINHFMPMSKCEKVAELTWENRQIGMHGVGGILSMSQTKPTILGRTGDTLESIVHQATHHGQNQTSIQNYDQNQNLKIGMCVGKWGESSQHKMAPGATVLAKKRMRSESEPQYSGKLVGEDEYAERSACASASATFCRENDTAMVTWPSFDESSRSIKSKTTCDEDSACHDGGSQENKEEEHETKRSNSSRRSRAAVVHNQSERRRRDRINQKMKALQRLVPNASKTDKASMLDEVINYLKQLQAQVQLMNSVRNMAPQMMMPLGMHQHIQMSLLARMGMGVGLGMGMGMFDMTALARAAAATAAAAAPPHQSLTTHPLIHTNPIATPATPFIPSAFAMPAASAIPSAAQANNTVGKATTAPVTPATTTTSNSAPFTDTYSAFLTQSMDMEYYNNMAALYRQQANNHSTQTTCSKLNQENLNIQGQRE